MASFFLSLFNFGGATEEVVVRKNRRDPYGLHTLYPTEECEDLALVTTDIDIIAVHGLDGDPWATWTDELSDRNWLKDFLPKELPNARIMTFGYNSGIAYNKSVGTIEDFSKELLSRIRLEHRKLNAGEDRPLIFICHSLGGIVVKKALILAHENEDRFGFIKACCRGIVFLGTPHRGSAAADLAKILSTMINALTLSVVIPRTTLINDLRSNSSVLQTISKQFVRRTKGLEITSFYEREVHGVGVASILTVDEDSATLGLVNEITLPINANHRDMCKFSHEKCQKYLLVKGEILEMVRKVSKPKRSEIDVKHDEELRQMILQWLDPEHLESSESSGKVYESKLEEREKGTCNWFWKNSSVKAWLHGNSSILWVHGGPGIGKSVLCSSIISKLSNNDPPSKVAYFFCTASQGSETDSKTTTPKTDTSESILRNLVVRLIDGNSDIPLPKVLKDLHSRCKKRDSKPCPNRELRNILKWCLDVLGCTYIIIDGLDEVEEFDSTSLGQLKKLFKALEFEPLGIVKWLFISQKTKAVDDNIRHFRDTQNEFATYQEIDLANTEVDVEMRGEIMIMLRTTIKEIFSELEDYESLESPILAQLVHLIGNNFLCAKLLLDDLRDCPSIDDFHSMIKDYEPGLDNQYLRALRRMTSVKDTRWTDAAKRTLMYVTLSLKPLTVCEVQEALGIDVEITGQRGKKGMFANVIERLCLPLVTVCQKKRTMKLVHHSVKAFLLKQLESSHTWDTTGIDNYFIEEKKGNTDMALACLSYLCNNRYSNFLQNSYDNLQPPSPERSTGISKLNIEDECEDREHAFLKYAAIFWHRHADAAELTPDLIKVVTDFIQSPNFITCLRVQSLYAPYHFGSFISNDGMNVAYADTVPGWLESSELSQSNGKEMAFQYYSFVKEWGHVLGRYPGEIERCLTGTLGDLFFSKIKTTANSYFLGEEKIVRCADVQISNFTSIAELQDDGWVLTLKTKLNTPETLCQRPNQTLELWHFNRKVDTIPQLRWSDPDVFEFASDGPECPVKLLNCCNHPLRKVEPCVEWPTAVPPLVASQALDFVILNGSLFNLHESGGAEIHNLRNPLIEFQFPTTNLTPLSMCMSTSRGYLAIGAIWECDICKPEDGEFSDASSEEESGADSDAGSDISVFIGTGFATEPLSYGFFKLLIYDPRLLEDRAPLYEFGGHFRRIPGENSFQSASPTFHPSHPLVSWAPGFDVIISADLSTGSCEPARTTRVPRKSNVIARELHYSECGELLYEVKMTLRVSEDAPFHSGKIFLTTYMTTDVSNPNKTQHFKWRLDRPVTNLRVFGPPTINWTADKVYISFSNLGLSVIRIDLLREGARLFVARADIALPTSALHKSVRFISVNDDDAIIVLGGSQRCGPSLISAKGLLYWEEKDWPSRIDLSVTGGGKAGVFYECDEPSFIVPVRSGQIWTDRQVLVCS